MGCGKSKTEKDKRPTYREYRGQPSMLATEPGGTYRARTGPGSQKPGPPGASQKGPPSQKGGPPGASQRGPPGGGGGGPGGGAGGPSQRAGGGPTSSQTSSTTDTTGGAADRVKDRLGERHRSKNVMRDDDEDFDDDRGGGGGRGKVPMREAAGPSVNVFSEGDISHVGGLAQARGGGQIPDLRSTLRDAGDRLVIVLFYENECENCEAMRMLYEEFVVKYPDVLFLEANVHYNPDPIDHLRIKFLPTFIAFKNHLEVGRLVTIKAEELESLIAHNTPRKNPAMPANAV